MANENTVFALSCALADLASISEYDPKVCTSNVKVMLHETIRNDDF